MWGHSRLQLRKTVVGLLVTQAGCPHLKRHPCKAKIQKNEKAGRAAVAPPDLKPTTGPSWNDTTTTRSAECVVVLPFAKILKVVYFKLRTAYQQVF